MQLNKIFCNHIDKVIPIALLIFGAIVLVAYFQTEFKSSNNRSQSTEILYKSSNLDQRDLRKVTQVLPPKGVKRKKRFILFNDGGVVKLVLGVSYPILLADPIRSLSMFYNWHLQYTPPPIPLYAWSLYNTTTFPVARKWKRQSMNVQANSRDFSRELIYEAINIFFERENLPGRECLLKMICEISSNPFHVPAAGNLFHEFLNAIFIPSTENVKAEYWNAFNAGHHGAVCDYPCPAKINWLERNSILF